MVDVEQILNILELKEVIPEVENPKPMVVKNASIEFKNVSFTYDTKLAV